MSNPSVIESTPAPAGVCSMPLFGHGVGRRKAGRFWRVAKDGDPYLRAMLDRHYSRRVYKDGRRPLLFVGPGEKTVLVTEDGRALWVWRKFIDASGQSGVNCAVFRNEGDTLSSDLIRDAETIAWERWPRERLYTYVNKKRIRSTNPGACYKAAGWKRCGVTKGGLVILEKCPNDDYGVQSTTYKQSEEK